PTFAQFLPWPILIALFVWPWTCRATWGRHALLGLGFFVIMLLPFIGLSGLAAAGLETLGKHLSHFRPALLAVIALLLIFAAVESHALAATYADLSTYWTNAAEKNPDAWPAHNHPAN